jgi:hemolysin III
VTAEVQVPRLRGVSHEIALAFALPAGVALALSAHGTVARAAAIAFASSVVGMFGVSTLFHRITWAPDAKLWLGRIDHTMIYALIAGTYTPITLLVLYPGWRTPILAIVWGGALVATAAKFIWHDAPRWVAPVTCVILGGVALVALPQIFDRIGTAGALLLLSGGVLYAIGAVVYATRRPDPRPATFGYHEIFHSLVIAAVACQYATVAFYVLPRAA